MELTELKAKIIQHFSGSPEELGHILSKIDEEYAVFPFNEYEYLICTLLHNGDLSYDEYLNIRAEYMSNNPNLWIFEIAAPRGFGEKFAQTYIQGICPDVKIPNKKLDPNYSGDYDLWMDGIRIEVKASRAVDADIEAPLYVKALSRNTNKNFVMNFQQLKPQCCDVFIWLAIFRDEIVIWVMSSKEVLENPFYSKGQHRGNKGNEGQLHITQNNIHHFNQYQLHQNTLKQTIYNAFNRN